MCDDQRSLRSASRQLLSDHIPEQPHPGDVVITAESGQPSSYTVSVVPGPAQLRHETYDAALASARKFAQSQGVFLWFTNDRTTFSLLTDQTFGRAGTVTTAY